MISLIVELAIFLGLFFLEDFLIYKFIRRIDKKEREFLNEWETEHIKSLLKIKGDE